MAESFQNSILMHLSFAPDEITPGAGFSAKEHLALVSNYSIITQESPNDAAVLNLNILLK